MNTAFRWALSLWLLAVVLPAAAQQQSVYPGINKPYLDPDIAEAVRRFEGAGRGIFQKREAIVAACGLQRGMAVADVGTGTGFFARLFARQVGPTGKVFAVDISKKFVDHAVAAARKEGLENVAGVVSSDLAVNLPPRSVDVVFLCDTYHHFEFPFKIMATIHAAVRPGGRLVLLDYRKEEGKTAEWIMKHVRPDKATVIREVEGVGFRFDDELDLLKEQYLLRFTRAAEGGQR